MLRGSDDLHFKRSESKFLREFPGISPVVRKSSATFPAAVLDELTGLLTTEVFRSGLLWNTLGFIEFFPENFYSNLQFKLIAFNFLQFTMFMGRQQEY